MMGWGGTRARRRVLVPGNPCLKQVFSSLQGPPASIVILPVDEQTRIQENAFQSQRRR